MRARDVSQQEKTLVISSYFITFCSQETIELKLEVSFPQFYGGAGHQYALAKLFIPAMPSCKILSQCFPQKGVRYELKKEA